MWYGKYEVELEKPSEIDYPYPSSIRRGFTRARSAAKRSGRGKDTSVTCAVCTAFECLQTSSTISRPLKTEDSSGGYLFGANKIGLVIFVPLLITFKPS